LVLLTHSIDWAGLELELNLTFSPDKAGRPAKPIRLVAGLLMLQHMDGLSDEAVVAKWVENPYWQYFCGYDYLEWKFPLDASSLVRWRKTPNGKEGISGAF
jgi:transposase, IS5 family